MNIITYFFLVTAVVNLASLHALEHIHYSPDNSCSTPEIEISVTGNQYGLSNFHMCVAHNQLNETIWFLNNGWSPNNNDNPYCITPLMLATAYGAFKCAQSLVASGANPYQDNGTISAYGIAVRDNKDEFLTLFKEQLQFFHTTYHDLLQGARQSGFITDSSGEGVEPEEIGNNTNVITTSPSSISRIAECIREESEIDKPASKKTKTKEKTKKVIAPKRNKQGRFKKRTSGRRTSRRTFYGD